MYGNWKVTFKQRCLKVLQSCAIVASLSTVFALEANAVDAKFLPIDGKKLLIIGQDLDSVRAYTNSGLFPEPGGITNYTNPYNLRGVTDSWNYGSGTMHMQQAMQDYPDSALAIGLFISEASPYDRNSNLTASNGLAEIAQGVYDNNLQRLADFALSINPRPIFLRIGYEFDGPWNAHDPQKYINAYRYIVDFLSNAGVSNIAYVWQSANWGQNPLNQMLNWYPGDNYVDWLGISFFFYDEGFNGPQFDEMLQIARSKNKPVMIAETSAQYYDFTEGNRYGLDGRPAESLGDAGIWSQYFEEQLLPLIDENSDVIRAMAWINANWREQPQWACCANGFWGDTRIEETQAIAGNWITEITDGTWIHGSASLLSDLGIDGSSSSSSSSGSSSTGSSSSSGGTSSSSGGTSSSSGGTSSSSGGTSSSSGGTSSSSSSSSGGNSCPASHPIFSETCNQCFFDEAQANSAGCGSTSSSSSGGSSSGSSSSSSSGGNNSCPASHPVFSSACNQCFTDENQANSSGCAI